MDKSSVIDGFGLNSLWAKIGDGTFADLHPLLCYLIDVGSVVGLPWQDLITDRQREQVTTMLSPSCQQALRKSLAFRPAVYEARKVCLVSKAQRDSE